MSKKLENISTPSLLAYQQIVGVANQQMDRFATDVQEMVEKKQIDKDYFDNLVKDLDPKVHANNVILEEIDKELLRRVNRDLKGATTGRIMTSVFAGFRKAEEAFRARQPKVSQEVTADMVPDPTPKKKPNLKVEK